MTAITLMLLSASWLLALQLSVVSGTEGNTSTTAAITRDPRQVIPLSRIDGHTFARSLGYRQPTSSFFRPSLGPNHFTTPIVFPPHSSTSRLSPYSVFASVSPSVRPTSPTFHAPKGATSFYGTKSTSPTIIQRLEPVSAVRGGYNALTFPTSSPAGGGYGSGHCSFHDSCQPPVYCAPCFDGIKDHCPLYGGHQGACCPNHIAPTGRGQQLFTGPRVSVSTPQFSVYQLNEAAKSALWQVAEIDKLEKILIARGIVVDDKRTPEYRHLQFFRTTIRAMRLGRAAITVQRSTYFLMQKYELTPLQAGFGLKEFEVGDTILSDTCPESPSCGEKEEYYRTIDGSCNNLRATTWGQAKTTFQRILPPHYQDGVYTPRGGLNTRDLPSPRVVSISNVADVDSPDLSLTLSVMQWGQFIDHDLTHAPIFRFDNDTGIECCNDDGGFIEPPLRHPACFPISIPEDDPFFSRFGRRCMNFVRSMPTQNENCTFGFAEQMNQITHFLDGSNVYGSSGEEERQIRAFQGGLLNVQGRALLPVDVHSTDDCDSRQQGVECFLAGDNRVNEQPDLAVMHTIWMREHNRLALQLAKINPHWDDETLYQESRRIVVAQMQHIVYNEWLPIILGKECMVNNGIIPRRRGYNNDYDPTVDATILNEFATVAFRFGHTLVQGMLQLFGKKHKKTDDLQLHEHFSSPHLLYTPGKLDEFLRGLYKQPIQKFDNFVSSELTNRLFQGPNMDFGMDLVALNIQRGRDHGIPPYNALRAACGLPRARDFEDLLDVIPGPVVQRLQRVYRSVDDIDAFVAGISERPVPGALVGPTFKCIIADQFIRLRRGDRFFYENGGMMSSFTEAQLREIRETSWARIMCDNGDHIKEVQPLAMRAIGPWNKKVPCDSSAIPRIDLTPWLSVSDH